ncbi:hypothetical protein ACWEWG_32235 [Streptomyces sp. NPDC003758]
MTTTEGGRLLPWSGPDGKPRYLSTDDHGSYLLRLADNTESVHLGMAAGMLDPARDVLGDLGLDPEELRSLAAGLAGALRDTLRVAISRGECLR